MKLQQYLLVLFTVLFFANCKQPPVANKTTTDTTASVKKTDATTTSPEEDHLTSDTTETVKLADGFKLTMRVRYGTGKYKDLQRMEIWHRDIKILTDTSDTASVYKFRSKLYPVLKQIRSGIFELVLEIYNGPSKDLAVLFRIENNKITKRELIPEFDSKPELINGFLTYHSIWDYGEMWDENNKRYTTYNPQLYYKVTTDGLKLDTVTTILKSKEKYGRFEGLTYRGVIGYPVDEKGNIIDTTVKNVLRKASDK